MTLYERTNYRNPDFEFIINKEIIEYDMRRAGLSLIKLFKLLPAQEIKYLDSLEKNECNIAIGNLQRNDKVFLRSLSQAFKDGRKLFFEANDLSENNILTIKKDAIFTTKECKNKEFEELLFVDKNRYTSYYLFDRYEYYYYPEGVDVKGISDENVSKHADHFLLALYEFMNKMENAPRSSCVEYMKDFISLYKNLKLPIEFYREMNSDSKYRLSNKYANKSIGVDQMDDKELIDIHYNFNIYLTNMIKILV